MLDTRTLWWVTVFSLPNLLWFTYLRTLVLANQSNVAQRGSFHWLDLGLPLAALAGLAITLRLASSPTAKAPIADDQRFRAVLALNGCSYWVIDRHLRILSIAAGPQNPLASLAAEMIGRHLWELALADDMHADIPAGERAVTIKTVFARQVRIDNFAIVVEGPNGPLRLALTVEPNFTATGTFNGFFGVASDPVLLNPANRLHEAALRAISAPLMITDANLDLPGPRISFVNRALCQMTGYSQAELLDATPRILQGPGTERSKLDELRQQLTRGEMGRMETLNYRKTGAPFLITWQISPVHDDDGKVCAFVAVLEDVTARRAAESTPGDMQAQLEERVRIRTRDLEHAARELEAFSFSLSHDLRAPLRIVEGFAEILSEDYGGKLDTLGNDHLKRIRNAATRMNQMITALLKMAKTTNAPLAREPIDLSLIAEELLNELAQEMPHRQVKVTIAPHIRVNADRVLMRNVMQNLLGNAWKFSAHAREARIEFGVAAEFGPETYFVRDNGAGFDMKYIDRLFAAFQRLHSQSEFAGTGIGLATVQRIINRHGGKIWARAEINNGAIFYFTLADTVSSREPAQLRR